MTNFRGTARYEIVRELGAGGMGVVYEAIDRERDGRRVALKVLQRQDPDSLSRLKREFRALADVRHPNLAALYELSVDGDVWFFSLELIDGVDFMSWVRPHQQVSRDAPTAELGVTVRSPGASDEFEASRLESAFRQLVAGVAFLHSQGRLHRDLKPSNVLVTKEGRVVILDFGLVLELEGAPESDDGSIVGTAAYMAPEQAGSGVIGAAADWYAVGVMLFQALTGRVPFDGIGVQVLLDKQRRPSPSPRDFVPTLPPELDALCAGLLRRETAERFGAPELQRRFGGETRSTPRLEAGFVGRDAELDVLRESLKESRAGAPVVVTLTGVSGVGKSALVRRFVTEVDGVVLQGRCYERESVPYKALDSVIDALVRHLSTLSSEKVDALLPRDAAALVRMFPVLGKVRAFRDAPLRDVKEATELRRRAVHALRELLGRIGDRSPLVVVIDDAQWGDADSAQVLQELIHGSDAPPVLAVLVFTAREPNEVPSPVRGEGQGEGPIAIHLSELDEASSRRLAKQLGASDEAARESRGNPF
ncbi:MAG: serine/threonine-protein kinase PknK, partial [Archangium sp.]